MSGPKSKTSASSSSAEPTVLSSPAYSAALAALAAGATVVTPTRRLATAVRRAYDAQQHAAGRRAWPAADIVPWQAWQQRQWESAQLRAGEPLPLLLTAQQELALWERVVGESADANALLHRESLAQTARDAWGIVCAHRLKPALRRWPVSEEGRAFLGWSEAFEHFCAREFLLDSARLADRLIDLLQQRLLTPPPHLVVYGFDGEEPQRTALLEALQAAGTVVATVAAEGSEGETSVLAEPDAKGEVRAAARWARAILERDPGASIGVIVPDLTRRRAHIARIFDEVLVPAAAVTVGAAPARPWNLSLGLALSQWPVVYAALLLLELAADRLSAQAASVLLRSPFLGGAQTERAVRALLDARMRRIGEPHVDVDRLDYLARDESRRDACPLLVERLRLLRARVRASRDERLLPSAWGPRLQSLLAAAGWPGERTLDSEEYQAVEAWRELLAGLSGLDLIFGRLALPTAAALVRRLAGERLFQPETQAVPIQVMGVLESTGLEFDHLIVLGLHAEAWPRPAHPNPLLPIELQRQAGVPGSGPEWELGFARRMTAAWQRAAPRVVFSFPAGEDDRTLAPSPVLAGLPTADRQAAGARTWTDYRALVQQAGQLESLEDIAASALEAGVSFGGGARLIQDQAACPFRAFAAHRLGAAVLEEPHEGLDAGERGSILHQAAAQVWGALSSSRRLAALDEEALAELVRNGVEIALTRWRSRRASVFQQRFVELERRRLEALLHEWLALERQRAPFEVIAVEAARRLEVGGVQLELRLDRVDRLEDGGELLLDYKTGPAAVSRWFDSRPDEPQLPLYTLTGSAPPAGLAFARVARGECAFSGIAERDGIGPGIEPFAPARGRAQDWAGQLEAWRQTLATLGEQFRAGVVIVDPKRYPATCANCGLRTLCRVEELLERAPEAGGETEEEV